jgi:energy-coupling factor transporter ATP-binding protein EcfA2
MPEVKRQPTEYLISLERRASFELLIELILHQREALILCGSDGIGKTTLLKSLRKNKASAWVICFFQATAQLSWDEIETQLIFSIQTHATAPSHEALVEMLCFYAEHQQKVVLIIDNAQALANGLMDQLIHYSLKYPAIRLIFALTKPELILKNKTDKAIDHGYFIEIPALDKSQLGVFLQMLSIDEINTALINKLYARTQGIPGKIIAELQQDNHWFTWQKCLISIGSLCVGFTLIYLYKPIVEQSHFYKQFLVKSFQIIIDNSNTSSLKPTVIPIIAARKPTQSQDNRQWVLQQAPNHYTLQLMLTPKKNALLTLLTQYSTLPYPLNYIQVKRANKQQYILLYGSFSTAKAAQEIAKTLPKLFKQAWPKRFKTIQAEIKSAS